jgi:hypothetical protein
MTDIQDIYSRDPMSYSKQDEDALIEDLRKKRKNFSQAGVPAKSPTRVKATAADDLQLDIKL